MVRIDNASDLTYMVLYPGSPSVNKKKGPDNSDKIGRKRTYLDEKSS